MARVKDLWWTSGEPKRKTAKHPDNSGNREACRWLACWTGSDGREKTKAFRVKAHAQAHATAQEADRLRGVYVDQKRGRTTLEDYATGKWLPAQVHLRPNSADTYGSHLRTHILPMFGRRRLGELQRSDMKAFVGMLADRLAASTVHTVFAVLRSVLQSAVDDGMIPANPCARVPLPRVEPRVVVPMAAADVLALADAITGRYRVTVLLGAGLGLREGEALGLTVARVDFLRRIVRVEEQAQGGKLVPLKTKASRRRIPADDLILAEITRHMQRPRWTPGPEGVLVTNRCGRIAQRKSFNTCWREAVEEAGLPEGTRFHDLRHFYASGLIRANLNPKVVQSRLGHATMAETWDTYGHLFPDDEEAGRGAIESLLVPEQAEPGRNSTGS
ncbi:tyrosine-type recombinase/integrase [Actinomadura sp. NPDC023710]|uniref:tyrosine-type recombinase/integrase n=1 Tax=Actinomadura sp. NPDC023710 TaxID=3158219 RepID=UPI0033D295F1